MSQRVLPNWLVYIARNGGDMRHSLKIGDEYLKNLIDGRKKVEIRYNDRDYQVGDVLEFYAPSSVIGETGEYVQFIITHAHSGLGMAYNYVALSVAPADAGKEE